MLGKLLDHRYRIVKELAEGGFSQTYLAEDTRLPKNPQCVVKHLNPTIDDPVFTQKALELFKAEAETLQELGRHDLIPQLYAYFQENKEFYLVQEFIAGHPLSKELTPGSQMSEARVAQIVKEVLEILKFVHQYNVIHRDIKPSNLIRRHRDGKLVLIDFGTVKQVQMDVANAHHKARVTLPIGTPGYMSYEQERGQSVANSDIYSLGMVALQALTGKHPNQLPRDRDNEITWRNYAKVSREFGAILDRMIKWNTRDRYQTIDEVLKDIAKLPKLSNVSPIITDDREPKPTSKLLSWLLPTGIIFSVIAIAIYLFNNLSNNTNNYPFSNISNSNPASPTSSTSPSLLSTPAIANKTSSGTDNKPDDKTDYTQLRNYLNAQNWQAADNETYLLLLKVAGKNSYNDGTFHADEFKRISCADLVLIDQLWTQASNGKQGLTAQKRIYENSDRDLLSTYSQTGWLNASGQLAINTAYNRQTQRWEYLSDRQPNFKNPPVGHLPFLLRDPTLQQNNLEKNTSLYRCSLAR